MTFSIVIPLHDKAHTIARTLESVRAQSFPDFDLVVVDDGSSDGGPSLVPAADDPRIRLVRQAHTGPGPARNAGVEAARHNWIAFLDADDLWLPDHLAELDRIRLADPDAGLIGTAFVFSRGGGGFDLPEPNEGRIARIDYIARVADGFVPLCASSAAIHRRAHRALGGFASFPSGQDSEYWARIALAWPVAVSTRVTAVYVRGTGGLTESAGSRWLGVTMRRAHDLSPAAATLLDRLPQVESPVRRETIERFVDRTFADCVRASVRLRDFRTLRSLPPLYRRRPPLADMLLLGAAFLPRPAADAVYRLGFGLKALARRGRKALRG